MNADGSEVTRLTMFAEGGYAAWSPDGSRIAFSALYCSAYYYYDACYPAVFIQTGSQISGIVVGDRPSWSPDGRKIAYSGFDCDRYYTSCVEGPFRIARVDGTDVVEVASGSAPTWRPR
jgi:Tol biopolymer transport system component